MQSKIDVLGVKINNLTKPELLQELISIVNTNADYAQMLTTSYSEFIVEAQKNQKFKQILNSAAINTADGIGVVWAGHYLNRSKVKVQKSKVGDVLEFFKTLAQIIASQNELYDVVPEKISGADLIWDIAEIASKNQKSVYLLGGYGDVTQPLLKKYPNLKIAGRYEGYPQEQGLVEKVNEAQADILLVAFGPVKQEIWIADNLQNLNVKLVAGLGGTFDYVTGRRKRAGEFWQKNGLEWLHRLFTQPWRWRRMWNAVVVFPWLVLKEKLDR